MILATAEQSRTFGAEADKQGTKRVTRNVDDRAADATHTFTSTIVSPAPIKKLNMTNPHGDRSFQLNTMVTKCA